MYGLICVIVHIRLSVHTGVNNVHSAKNGLLTFLGNCPNLEEAIQDCNDDFEVVCCMRKITF